jgi:hypothetical protein
MTQHEKEEAERDAAEKHGCICIIIGVILITLLCLSVMP